MRQICADDTMPGRRTVHSWLFSNREFQHQYALACELRADEMNDEILDIVDDGQNDWMDKKLNNGETIEVVNHEHIQRSKLRAETRKWILAHMNPKKYGEKIQQEISNPDGSLTMTPEQRAVRLAAIAAKASAKRERAPDDTDSDLGDLC